MAATYPPEDLKAALDAITWNRVEVQQTENGQYNVKTLDRDDATVKVDTATRVIVDCDSGQTMLLGMFKRHLEEALRQVDAQPASIMPEDASDNEFCVFAVNRDKRHRRATQY